MLKCICLHFCPQEAGAQMFGAGVAEALLNTVDMMSHKPLECA